MQINAENAVSILRSADRQVRSQLDGAKGKSGGSDSVELGQPQQVLSKGYVQLQQEMTDQLSSLNSLISDNSSQQKGLKGLFGDANNDEAVKKRAQELLDGYFNVENTGDRIFEFAFANYKGGDREEFARKFQGYIHKGFAEAEKLLGGLADISVKTRDYVDKRIEEFIKEGEESDTAPVETADAAASKESDNGSTKPGQANSRDELQKKFGDRVFIPEI